MTYKHLIIFCFLLLILLGEGVSLGASTLESFIPKKDLPKGWALLQAPQTYSRKTLFNHIDGQAELFLQYGYQGSVFAVYQKDKNQENQIEVDLYDMKSVLQAFGVFSRFRNDEKPGGFGLDSFLDDHSALFYQGRYFVMLYASELNPETLKQIAKLMALIMPADSPPPKEIGYFPRDGLKPGSIQYFPEGLLGYQFLKRGFQAIYKDKVEAEDKAEDKEIKLFLAIFKDNQEATNALATYKETLSKKGKIFSEKTISSAPALRGEDPYQGKIIVLQKGIYLLGTAGFDKQEKSETRLIDFMKSIK